MTSMSTHPEESRADALAAYYDAIVPWLDRDLAERGDLGWWSDLAARLAPGRVVDLGCGTGRITRTLAAPGRRVVGVDRLFVMVSRARQRLDGVEGVRLVQGDLRAPPLGPGWDLVAAANDPFIHLRRDRDRQEALDASAALLDRDGRLVMDLLWWTPEDARKAGSPEGLRRVRESTPDQYGPLRVEELWRVERDGCTVEARYRYVPATGAPVTASFRGRRWTLDELRRRLARAGLDIVRLRGGYDDRPFEPSGARALLVEARRTGAPMAERPRERESVTTA